ncbi:uncharacterized protein BDR25DRAFT_351584 [Lindgomyces ingoldianus]|uniref:Uncharacterized protein n=1 Tax=Lindgomyces ingoldianus TaxID=673940 RepID=A0ACB6R6W6_9PLEO|nr:uncharacterized protein BDR25DRAFT_351584 [Lindgomyces ingoldianus]KAF2474052.1 hypothetical protein BDR25DRAFT_351584 [Lindgomyces ingoldianus]
MWRLNTMSRQGTTRYDPLDKIYGLDTRTRQLTLKAYHSTAAQCVHDEDQRETVSARSLNNPDPSMLASKPLSLVVATLCYPAGWQSGCGLQTQYESGKAMRIDFLDSYAALKKIPQLNNFRKARYFILMLCDSGLLLHHAYFSLALLFFLDMISPQNTSQPTLSNDSQTWMIRDMTRKFKNYFRDGGTTVFGGSIIQKFTARQSLLRNCLSGAVASGGERWSTEIPPSFLFWNDQVKMNDGLCIAACRIAPSIDIEGVFM